MAQGSWGMRFSALGAVMLLGLGVAACGDEGSSTGSSSSSSTSGTSSGGGEGGGGGMGGGGMGGAGGAGGAGDVCAKNNSLCFDVNVPADLAGTPKTLSIVGYKMLPPGGFPDAIFSFGTPVPANLPKGQPYPVKLENITAMGSLYVYVVLFMEGGGTMMPVANVDYTGASATTVDFTGAPATTAPIDLKLYVP